MKYLLLFSFISVIGSSYGDRRGDAIALVLTRLNDPQSYDKNIPPPTYNKSVDVDVTLLIRNVDLDDEKMTMRTDLTFRMEWFDERLRFAAIKDVPEVTLTDFSKLWIPDPFFRTALETELQSTIHPEAYVRINRDGHVLFSSRFVVTSSCPMMFNRFPHDHQECSMYLASYGYKVEDVTYNLRDDALKLVEKPVFSERFSLLHYKSGLCNAETTTGSYSCVKATLSLKRHFKIYLAECYMPCMCLVILGFLSELISPDLLIPRLTLTLAPLLTLSVVSIIYREHLPSVPYTTALDIFTGVSFLVIFVTLLNVIVRYYYVMKKRQEPEEENPEEKTVIEEGEAKEDTTASKASKLAKAKAFLKRKNELVIRILLIGFYGVFIFLYFAAYSVNYNVE